MPTNGENLNDNERGINYTLHNYENIKFTQTYQKRNKWTKFSKKTNIGFDLGILENLQMYGGVTAFLVLFSQFYDYLQNSQIFYLLTKKNLDIRGILLGSNEIKMSQFADDTTLILDETQRSLQTALNPIEVFGSFSGLRMNKSKTKLIWIGRKMHLKNKLEVNQHLKWGESKFTSLGINFEVAFLFLVNIIYPII